MQKLFLLILILFHLSFINSYAQMPDCSKVLFYEDNITIGSCVLNVYKADTYEQKLCGMLNFTDKTFYKDGMIFMGNSKRIESHNFHTMGMNMTIRIMGIVLNENGKYSVYNKDAKYSPPNIPSVTIYGNAVFETSEHKYNKLKSCLYNKE